ncbi:MAG: TetR/AcrR family transcriptional regulator [Nocardioides sp.]|nr:TetR/AcrR family transcriptional regulator [Nocardioides sp.]
MSAAAGARGPSPTTPPARADRRRASLLAALDAMLREQPLAEINVADISNRAGVTRSAFYFYFESKAVAVSALMAEVYDDSFVAATLLRAEDETPRARIKAGLQEMFETLDQHAHLYAAMLEARATSNTVRELWDAARESFVEPVATTIRDERAAGRAPGGPDATSLASLLLELNDRVLEREVRGSAVPREEHLDAVVAIWTRTIFGTDDPTPRSTR